MIAALIVLFFLPTFIAIARGVSWWAREGVIEILIVNCIFVVFPFGWLWLLFHSMGLE